jgi:hypothetical protein
LARGGVTFARLEWAGPASRDHRLWQHNGTELVYLDLSGTFNILVLFDRMNNLKRNYVG